MSKEPITRMYTVRVAQTGWARIWITDDGCFTCLSDYGNYGYWWGGVEGEFRKFLIECDNEYLGDKLAGGKLEFDDERTVRTIRERIRYCRRSLFISKELARYEWRRAGRIDSEYTLGKWADEEQDPEAIAARLFYPEEYACYGPSRRLQGFFKKLWPAFIEQLKNQLQLEASLPAEVAPGLQSPP